MAEFGREAAIDFLKNDGWIVSAVEYTDVPRVMVEFASMAAKAERQRILQYLRDYRRIEGAQKDDSRASNQAQAALTLIESMPEKL